LFALVWNTIAVVVVVVAVVVVVGMSFEVELRHGGGVAFRKALEICNIWVDSLIMDLTASGIQVNAMDGTVVDALTLSM
jgi:hypothetical protein